MRKEFALTAIRDFQAPATLNELKKRLEAVWSKIKNFSTGIKVKHKSIITAAADRVCQVIHDAATKAVNKNLETWRLDNPEISKFIRFDEELVGRRANLNWLCIGSTMKESLKGLLGYTANELKRTDAFLEHDFHEKRKYQVI